MSQSFSEKKFSSTLSNLCGTVFENLFFRNSVFKGILNFFVFYHLKISNLIIWVWQKLLPISISFSENFEGNLNNFHYFSRKSFSGKLLKQISLLFSQIIQKWNWTNLYIHRNKSYRPYCNEMQYIPDRNIDFG